MRKRDKIRYAIGVTSAGRILEIDTSFNWVLVSSKDLVSLEIPEGVTIVQCEDNKLKMLNWPETVHSLRCDKELFDYDTCGLSQLDIIYKK